MDLLIPFIIFIPIPRRKRPSWSDRCRSSWPSRPAQAVAMQRKVDVVKRFQKCFMVAVLAMTFRSLSSLFFLFLGKRKRCPPATIWWQLNWRKFFFSARPKIVASGCTSRYSLSTIHKQLTWKRVNVTQENHPPRWSRRCTKLVTFFRVFQLLYRSCNTLTQTKRVWTTSTRSNTFVGAPWKKCLVSVPNGDEEVREITPSLENSRKARCPT